MRRYFIVALVLILVSCGRDPIRYPALWWDADVSDASVTLDMSHPPDGGDTLDSQTTDATAVPDLPSKLPDLTVPEFKATVQANTVSYSVKVCNAGTVTAGPFALHLYYHQTSPPKLNQPGDQSENVEGLKAGDCVNLSFQRTGAPSGDAASWVYADAKDEVQESDEGNNIGGAIKVSVHGDPGPDLVAQNLTSTLNGTDIEYAFEICNIGEKSALLFRVDLYYKSYWSPSPLMIGDTDFYVLTLGPGNCKSFTHTYSNAPVDSYNSYVQADTLNTVKEVNEYNNTDGPVSLTVSAPSECIEVCVFATACGQFGLLDALNCLTWCNGMDNAQRQCVQDAAQNASCSELEACTLPSKPPPSAPPWVCYDICNHAIYACSLLPENQFLTCIGGCLTLPETKRQCAMKAVDQKQCLQLGLCLF